MGWRPGDGFGGENVILAGNQPNPTVSENPSANSRPDRGVDYVEFAARDVPTARRFYAAVFGWTFEDYGPDYTSFHDGRIGGGFFTAPAGWQPTPAGSGAPLVVLYVAAGLEAAQTRVEEAGGRIVRPIFAFPGGRRFHFTDPSGNELAVWAE